tara:strand:+ start:1025 stop:1246 length:222 start_codon:yes stop_codon:yes gene_type:complete
MKVIKKIKSDNIIIINNFFDFKRRVLDGFSIKKYVNIASANEIKINSNLSNGDKLKFFILAKAKAGKCHKYKE